MGIAGGKYSLGNFGSSLMDRSSPEGLLWNVGNGALDIAIYLLLHE